MKIGLGFDKYPEEYDYIATFKNVIGLEGDFIIQKHLKDENPIDLCELTLFECNIPEGEFIKKFDKESALFENSGYIYILSSKEVILTSNFISDMQITELFEDSHGNLNVKIQGWLFSSSKGFYEIAEKRLTSGIETKGQWKSLSSDKVQGWLDAAIRLGQQSVDVSNKVASIDSEGIDSHDKFYCAIGEAVNGAGGYFGRNLDALNDCFSGGFGVKDNFTLNWINHDSYKKQFPKHFAGIIEVFSDCGKKINLK